MNRHEIILLFVATVLAIVATTFGFVGLRKCIVKKAPAKITITQFVVFALGIFCIFYVFNHVKF